MVGGVPPPGSCISHSSLEGSGPRDNDPAPRPTIAQPTTIVHWISQYFRSFTRPPYFTHNALDEKPSPRVPLESSSPEGGGVPEAIYPQEIAVDKGPFTFTPSQLAALLESKDLGALEAIGGVESLLRGLGTHPTSGLLIRVPDCGGGYPCSQSPGAEGKWRLVEPYTPVSIICDHAGDRRDPYNATLQERKQVFGENLPLRVKKSWLITLIEKALVCFSSISPSLKKLTFLKIFLWHCWIKNRVGDGPLDGQKSQFSALKQRMKDVVKKLWLLALTPMNKALVSFSPIFPSLKDDRLS